MRKLLIVSIFLCLGEIIQAQDWSALGSGMNNYVRAFVVYNGEIYVGGNFTTAGGITANHIAKWNGATWSEVGLGTDGTVFALALYNNELYAGGDFTTAGGIGASHIAKWDGTTWTSLGSGTSDNVLSMCVFNGELYAGGAFTTAGGNSANYIAKWNGTSWSSVGSGMVGSDVNCLEVYNAQLYAGGIFTMAGGVTASNVAKWNGTSWSDVGSGTNNLVAALRVYDSELYAGGAFTVAGGVTVSKIAKWNGTSWSDVGLGFDNTVRALTEYNSELIATGAFITTVSGTTVNRIASWDGTSWTPLGSGFGSTGWNVSVYNSELYAGGLFTTAGGNPANYIAKWSVGCTSAPNQPGIITGNNSVCQGSSQTYSVTPVSGADSYTWTPPTGWTGTSNTNSITVTVGANSGTISVTADNSCGSSTPQTKAVTVNTVPAQPGSITGSNAVCQGTSQTYSITAVSGATSYTWTLPNGWTGNSTTTSITTTIGANSGSISVTANNTCGSSTAQTLAVIVTSVPSQPGPIDGNNLVCPGSSQTYSISAVSGATSYSWTVPSGWTGSSNTNSITATVGSNGGTISVTANNNCGSSTPQNLVVTLNSIPTQPGAISGSSTVCQSSSQTYSLNAVSGATSYTWTLPSGWTGSSTTTSITAVVGANSGNISVTANNSCGSSTAQVLAINVSPVPAQPGAISGNNSVCQGSSQTYSITEVSGATSYTWSLPPGGGWTGSSTTTSITTTVGGNSGSVSVTANNSCGNSTAQLLAVTVLAVPAQPGAIMGSNILCQGSMQIFYINPVSGATSYTWTLPPGWTGTSSISDSITVTAGANSGIISVTANNSCWSSTPQTLMVTINSVPAQPGDISGNNAVCQGSLQTYSIADVPGATSYTWTLPSGWTGSSTSTSITTIVGGNSESISVTANNNCGSSIAQTLSVTINSAPAQPDTIIGNTFVCPGSVQTYSLDSIAGAESYTWTLPSGWTGSSTTNSISVTVDVSGGSISVIAINSCGSSIAQALPVTVVNAVPVQPGAISGSNTVCEGSSQIYSIEEVSGASSYTWMLPPGWTGSSTVTSITVTVGENAGNISVTAENGCGSSPAQTIAITVDSMPAQPGAIAGSAVVNVGQALPYSIDEVPGATGYNWSLSGGGSITSGQNTIAVSVIWDSAGNDTLSVTSINDCGTSSPQKLPVMVSIASGVNDPEDPFAIQVMPNPFQDQVYLKAEGVMNKIISVEIWNLSGQTIYRSQLIAGTNDYSQLLDLGMVAAGLYQVKIVLDKKIFFRTLAHID